MRSYRRYPEFFFLVFRPPGYRSEGAGEPRKCPEGAEGGQGFPGQCHGDPFNLSSQPALEGKSVNKHCKRQVEPDVPILL